VSKHATILSLGICAASVLAPPARAENLVKNGSFEDGMSAWRVPPPESNTGKNVFTPDIDKKTSHAGPASLRMVGRPGKQGRVIQNISPTAKRLQIAGWIRTEGFSPDWLAKINLWFLGDNNKWLGMETVAHTPRGPVRTAWSHYQKIIDLPDNARVIVLVLETNHVSGKLRGTNTGVAWFDDIKVTSPPPAQKPRLMLPVSIQSFYPHGVKGLFLPGQTPVFTLRLNYSGDKNAPPLQLATKVYDFDQQIVYHKDKKLTLNQVGTSNHELRLPTPAKLGFYSVHGEIRPDPELSKLPPDTKPVTAGTSFCVITPPQGPNDPFFGISRFRWRKWMLEPLRLIGVGSLFLRTHWGRETQPGHTDWSATDAALDFYQKSGWNVIGYNPNFAPHKRPGNTPKWELKRIEQRKAAGKDPYPDEHFQAYGRWVQEMVSRYKGRIKTWYICNEIDVPMRTDPITPMEYYVKKVIAFSKAARKADPNCRIAAVGVAGSDADKVPPYPAARAIWKHVHEYIDEFWPHPYASPRTIGPIRPVRIPETFLRRALFDALELIRPYGKDTLGISENGYSIHPDHALEGPYARQMAKLTARTTILARTVPQLKCLCYFTANKTRESGHTYGLWEDQGDGSVRQYKALTKDSPMWPRPVVAAYATTTRFLAHTTDPRFFQPHKEVYGCGFKRASGWVFPMWVTGPDPATVQIDLPAAVEVFDLMGNRVTQAGPGPAELKLTDSPIFIASADPEPGPFDQAVARFQATCVSLPIIKLRPRLDRLNRLAVDVVNQMNKSRRVTVELSAVKGLIDHPIQKVITIPPLTTRTAFFNLPTARLADYTDNPIVAIATTPDGKTAVGTRKLRPLAAYRLTTPPTIDADLSEYTMFKPIILDSGQYVEPPDVVPGGLWTGPKDCSLRAWLAWDQKNLYLAAEVTDQAQVQEKKLAKAWKQDSLMLALDAGNDALPPEFTHRTGYDGNDLEIVAVLSPNGPAFYCHFAPGGAAAVNKGGPQVAVKRQDDSLTCYEMAIPWRHLKPLKPHPGAVFNANILYADADTPGRKAPYWMALTTGIHTGKNPSAFRTFVLTAPSHPTTR